jgi:transcriptional regulator with XRE-family HTH domain
VREAASLANAIAYADSVPQLFRECAPRYCRVNGLTFRELAKRLGITNVYLSYLVRGHKEASVELAKRLLKLMSAEGR